MWQSRRALVLFLFIASLTPRGFGQATSGSILGRITDATDAVVVDAEVIARNENTGLKQRSRTDNDGYVVRNLPPGTYTITVSKSGFKMVTQSDVLLVVDQKLRLDFVLQLGSTTDTVTVTSEAPLLQTQSVETGDVIQSRQILNLPLESRQFLELAKLSPGVISGGGGNSSNLAVNGQREFANSIMIDGVETTSNRNNDNSLSPSVDAVEQFKVVTSAYSAEFGRAAGGVVSIQTKSGSNGYHGSAYEFFRPNNTAALPYNFGGVDLPSALKHHNFGATIGGPIKKDKLFFFVSFEGFRLRNLFSYLDSVPPVGQINYLPNGDVDLSGMIDPKTGNQIPIFDPQVYLETFVAEQFPGNIIPANRVSPAGKAVLQNFFPAPNLPGDLNGWYSNYAVHQSYKDDTNNIDSRLDYDMSEHDRISGIYHYGDLDEGLGDRFAGDIPVIGGGTTDSSIQNSSLDQSMSISETHIFSQNWLNEFRFGYSRFRLDQKDLLNDSNAADKFGVGNVNLTGFPATQGFPQFFLGTGYNTGGSTYLPLFFHDNNFQISDNISAKVGKHELKFGIDYRRLRSNPNFSLFPTGYQYYASFGQSLTSDPNFAYFDENAFFQNGGNDIADLLLGLPQQVSIGLQLTNPTTKSWETGLYFQDTWQATPNLVLDYGLRHEYQGPYTEADNQAANFDPTTLSFLIAGRGGHSSSLLNPDKNNFGPRVGLSYRIGQKTVIRAGFGVYFTPENDARNDVFTKNYPFAEQNFYFTSPFAAPDYQLDAGIPRDTAVVPIPQNGVIAAADIASGSSLQSFYVDPDFPTGYSELYNLTVQRELMPNLSLDVAYVGSGGHKLPYAVGDVNSVDPATSARRITALLGQIQGQFPVGASNYNSLQAKLTKRYSGGLSFQTSYTYGKGIDNGPAPFNLGRANLHNQPQDPFDLEAERSVSDNDVTHNLVFNSVYELPIGKGKRFFGGWSGKKQTMLGGWQVNSIVQARSGLPANVVQNPKSIISPGLRPNVIGDPILDRGDRTLAKYFNTAAFCIPSDTSTTCPAELPNGEGTAPRNPLRGPGYVNTDLSLFKEFAMGESRKLQFRFEFFNLFNTPHFANPNTDMTEGNFGQITSTIGDQRQIQFALKFLF